MGTNIIAILIDSPYDRDKIILKINADKILKFDDFTKVPFTDKKNYIDKYSLKDLVWLFHNSPDNCGEDGMGLGAKIKRGKRQEFAEYFVKMMLNDAPYEQDCFRWGIPFEDIFRELTESAEDFCKYEDEDE